MSGLRTEHFITPEMQDRFYENVICNENSKHRYVSFIKKQDGFVGIGGITNISWSNRTGEISLILMPGYIGQGIGSECVQHLLDYGFNRLNMQNIYGECYESNPFVKFWERVANKHDMYTTKLPNRKYWEGKYFDSLYFSKVNETKK